MPPDTTRVLRGVSVGALSSCVTVAGHRAGGGALPSETAGLLMLIVCSAAGCVAGAARGPSRSRLMAALVGAQVLGHLALTFADLHRHVAVVDERMLGAHLLAVVAGAYLVHGAERGMRWAVSALRRAVAAAMRIPVDPALWAPGTPVYRARVTLRPVDLSGAGTRGPPVTV
ncbi:hypothetical protein [Nocardia sp. CA-290969]|uniref:hypothetical protein n=1 Tax=Nocardia sp. CA-290969 TaxID=3239986 RepID=UPI003D8F675E